MQRPIPPAGRRKGRTSGRIPRVWLIAALSLGAWGALPEAAPADAPIERQRPAVEPREVPPAGPGEPPAFRLPSPPPVSEPAVPAGPRVRLRRIELHGNTVFTDEELAAVTRGFLGRPIDSEGLERLRHGLTRYYVDRGYINSGALIADQPVRGGVIRIDIVEGRLAEIRLSGNDALRDRYLRSRLAAATEGPLDIAMVQERMQVLQQDPMVRRLDAELVPGRRRGEARLEVRAEEEAPYQLGAGFANDRSPAVGGERWRVHGMHRSLTGWGDALAVQYGRASGGDDLGARYTLPLARDDTTLALDFQDSESEVIEAPFEALDISSELRTFGVSLSHPVYRTPRRRLDLGLGLEWRRSRTFLQGVPAGFSPGVPELGEPGAGESTVTVIRLRQEWLDRSREQVIAARSTFSAGIDALGATRNESLPDGRFFAWRGQFQWSRRLGGRGNELLLRAGLQFAADGLLPLEKFALGGAGTVRGYRESLLVRDNAAVASVELRLPVLDLPIPWLSLDPGDGELQVAPFADYGRGWNTDAGTPEPSDVASAGIGLRYRASRHLRAQVYWGHALRDTDRPDHDLQDSGLHFGVSLSLP